MRVGPVSKPTLDTLAFRIPYTKRHIRFTEETEALLKMETISYRVEVIDHEADQYAELGFYTAEKDLARAEAVVTITSRKLIPREKLGLEP